MAFLNVSEVIRDPVFTSRVSLIKRGEAYDAYGNPIYTDGTPFTLNAVVTNDTKAIRRNPGALQREGSIVVRFVVADAPTDFKAGGYDRVLYRGKSFVVTDVSDYSQFGEGSYKLTCSPENSSDGKY